MKTYAKKFNAQRAARAELGDDAIEGIDYRSVKIKDGYAWEQKRMKPQAKALIVEAIDAAPKESVSATEKAAGKQNAARSGKHTAIEAAARQGDLPEPPDFSAETHKRFRPNLAKPVEMAKTGDIDGLKAMEINPVSTSPRAMLRYRDLAIMALEARRP